MKRRYRKISYVVAGTMLHTYYICEVKKHWWSRWRIVMDGAIPQFYDKINNEYVARL